MEDLYYIVNPVSKRIYRRKSNPYGDFWTLRPSIYILEYEDQPNTNLEILEKFGNAIGKIMARSSSFETYDYKTFLGENLRKYLDYTLHVNEALTLWTMSRKGLEISSKDPNRNRIILEKQVQIEAIDHLYLSHRKLVQISSRFTIPYETILLDQLEVLNLEELVTNSENISNFGEINNLIKVAGEELHWNELRKTLEKKMKLRSEYSKEERNKSFRGLGYTISIIFGVIGASTFAYYVMTPSWNYLNLPLPVNKAVEVPFLFLITISILLIPILIIYVKTKINLE